MHACVFVSHKSDPDRSLLIFHFTFKDIALDPLRLLCKRAMQNYFVTTININYA